MTSATLRRAAVALLLTAASPAASVEAQSRLPGEEHERLEVWLVTIGQGGQVWEKFGHNALWFRDPGTGLDVAYNWGVFDFTEPGFVRRFLTGDTRYWVEAVQGTALIDWYQRTNRTITLQRLNLAPDQARRALQFSQWNAREENKYYRYDYFRDNCSTRLRDVLDVALGGALRAATHRMTVNQTYRSETLRLVDDMTVTQLGINLALGRPADRPLTQWDAMFIPMRLRDAIRVIQVPRGSGHASLVAEERVILESTAFREAAHEPMLWPMYLLIGLLLGAEFLAVGRAGPASRLVDRVFRVEVALWSLVCGVGGLILLLAWTSTGHVFWYRNENLLFVNPLSLLVAVAALTSIWKPRLARGAAAAALIVAALSVVALALKAFPGTQANLPLVLLVLPSNVAIAIGLWRRRPTRAVSRDTSDSAVAPA